MPLFVTTLLHLLYLLLAPDSKNMKSKSKTRALPLEERDSQWREHPCSPASMFRFQLAARLRIWSNARGSWLRWPEPI